MTALRTKPDTGTALHTPSPWGMETVRTSCGVCHKIGPWPHKWRAGDTMSACIYDDYPSPPEGTDTMLANARLIAAAPDMFEALRDVVTFAALYEGKMEDTLGDEALAVLGETALAALSRAEVQP